MAPKVESITECTELGEGPHWDPSTQSLYFVDIFGKSIHRYVPATKKHTKAIIEEGMVSIIIPVEGEKDTFIISIERNLAMIKWDGESDTVSKITKLGEVDNIPGTRDNRFNDGKCDPTGRLWVGTMGAEPINGQVEPLRGGLFSLEANQIKKHLSGVTISNGLAWNTDLGKFYYIDSPTRTIDQFDIDMKHGVLSNRTSIFTLDLHNIPGFPDGMAIDTDGNLWVAIFNGYRVIKIDPRKAETLLETIEIPAKQVTSVAFGGENLDELYVTSAAFTVNGEELPPPYHGAVFHVTCIGAKGLPGVNFQPMVNIHTIGKALEMGARPFWDAQSQNFYYVDIPQSKIYRYNPACQSIHSATVGKEPLSFAFPIEKHPDKFVVGLGHKISVTHWDGYSENVCSCTLIGEVDRQPELKRNQLNGGTIDPYGLLWTGTMGGSRNGKTIADKGSLYSMAFGQIKRHVKNIGISNGIAFDTTNKKMYYSDSLFPGIYQFDYDGELAEISNQNIWFLFETHEIAGLPADLALDQDGHLWVAVLKGSVVLKIKTENAELLYKIQLPTSEITGLAFGGENLNVLFVTSAKMTSRNKTAPDPAGCCFTLDRIGGPVGLPGNKYNISTENLVFY